MKNCFSSIQRLWFGLMLFGVLWLPISAVQAQGPNDCTGTDPGGQPAANGLYAEYFTGYFDDDPGFFSDNRNPAAIRRIEAQVNFPNAASFGDLLPTASGTADNANLFSLRLRGSILIPVSGSYTFYLTSDDASYLWIDNAALAIPPTTATALINNGGRHIVVERQVTIELEAGRHNVQLLYGDDCCENALVWEYSGPGITRQVIPSAALCTALVPLPPVPQGISYTPLERALPNGTTRSSGAPTVQSAGVPVTGFAIANAVPAGITINSATGVLTADASVAEGLYDIDVTVLNANGSSTFRNAFRFRVTAALPGGCGGPDPSGEPAASGLFAEYFSGYFADDPTFFTSRTAGIVRTDPQINFPANESFGNLLPVATGSQSNPDNFSLRLRGSLYLAAAGTYTFYLTADDAAYLWLDNAALSSPLRVGEATINNGGLHLSKEVAVTLNLGAGLHNIAVLYGDNGINNDMVLEYQSQELGIERQVVPGNLFCSSTQPLKPVATAISYAPKTLRVTVGLNGASALPTVTSPSPVVEYRIANASALPTGISINPANGQVSVRSGVAEGNYSVNVSARNEAGPAIFERALTAQVVAASPANCSGLDGSGGRASSGLYAELYRGYFDDKIRFFTDEPVAEARLTQAIDYTALDSWGDLSQIAASSSAAGGPDEFSVRLRGRISIPVTGTYTFYLTSDDGSFMWLDNDALDPTPVLGRAFINNGGRHLEETKSKTMLLTAGLHDIQILYGDNAGLNVLRLEYENTAANIARQVVSAAGLCTTNSNAPLPVTLTRFGAQPEASGVVVSWETAQEVNSASFIVERSVNGQVFESIGQLAAAGNSQRQQKYTFADRNPFAGTSYYRLRQLDLDGTAHFSAVTTVRWEGKSTAGMQLSVFPNPSTEGSCTIRFEQPTAAVATLQVLDLTGRTVYTHPLAASKNTEHMLRTSNLPAGVYMVRIISTNATLTQRLEVR